LPDGEPGEYSPIVKILKRIIVPQPRETRETDYPSPEEERRLKRMELKFLRALEQRDRLSRIRKLLLG
jgi:hypothetical protein